MHSTDRCRQKNTLYQIRSYARIQSVKNRLNNGYSEPGGEVKALSSHHLASFLPAPGIPQTLVLSQKIAVK